jgi:cysteinyl-tRNA synthetase
MPAALRVLNETVSDAALDGAEKYALLAAWDAVLGLDLERDAREGFEPSEEIAALVADRDAARAVKDWAKSDEIRDQLVAMGLEVMDSADGTKVRPQA